MLVREKSGFGLALFPSHALKCTGSSSGATPIPLLIPTSAEIFPKRTHCHREGVIGGAPSRLRLQVVQTHGASVSSAMSQ